MVLEEDSMAMQEDSKLVVAVEAVAAHKEAGAAVYTAGILALQAPSLEGMPCGACLPYSTKPCVASFNNLRSCSVCPGGGCSPCPAPVRLCPDPCPAMPVLPCLPPCPPCDKPAIPVPKPELLCDSVAIPCCRPNRCKPCPRYCCTEPAVCSPKRCSYPGVPVCGGCCGPCMPVW
ncbi:hypothetical protein ACJJTC_008757 [Scirpophaga incertulas]